ncbi:hypothetical protein EPI10_027796 [Gossypium australe]|uniref:Uncharacterized protein n=1 Tax=Gossypium australe TaxID=47621 RepID=A0A5B6UV95_9ROSI|nr:hypothetical protein EPI10_027796 [Gossypium australe]
MRLKKLRGNPRKLYKNSTQTYSLARFSGTKIPKGESCNNPFLVKSKQWFRDQKSKYEDMIV